MGHRVQRHRTIVAAIAATSLIVAACSGGDDDSQATTPGSTVPSAPSTSPTTATTTAPGTTAAPDATPDSTAPGPTTDAGAIAGLRTVAPFAEYRWVPPIADQVYPGPATPTSLSDVLLTPAQSGLTDPPRPERRELIERLEANGFAVDGQWGHRFFHDGYKASSYESYAPLFVTTDAIYHSWHLVFDRVLRDTEQQRLLPTLEGLVVDAVDAARAQETPLAGTELADAAHRATAYWEAAATVLGVDVAPINDLADAEVALVESAAGMETSPITGLVECQAPDSFVGCVDFSLFLPRGHYTRTADLERYFRGMSMLGQEGFALADGIGVVPALLATRVLLDDPEQLDRWTALYEPTAFLVGLADDIDPLQLAAAADRAVPGWRDDPEELAGADVEAIASAVLAEHPVAIDPERAAVKLMGARFTLDAFILDQLAWPNVGGPSVDERRVHVSALDVAAAFGSPVARTTQLATESAYVHYEEQLDEMTRIVAAREPDDWAGTVYDAWLIAIEPQFHDRGEAYPDFMRSDAWEAKSLQTGLASYTELKHDTVLYTKQGSSGEGEGPPSPEFEPRNWVEPDPVAFGRIAAAAALLRDGLAERGLLTDETGDLLATLIELSDWLAGIADRELQGIVASDDENTRLDGIGSELEYIWIAASEIELNEWGGAVPDPDERAALVTDIFTTSFDYLQLGTGGVEKLYVIVPLGDGRFELAEGQVFSYYEFWRSASEPRLTDEEWRMLVAGGATPPRPTWTSPFLVGVTGVRLGDILDAYEAELGSTDPGSTYSLHCDRAESVSVGRGALVYCQISDRSAVPTVRVGDLHLLVLDDEGTSTSWETGPDGASRPPGPDGLLCREYMALPEFEAAMLTYGETPPWNGSELAYQWVLAYWFDQGEPVRMDVDGNEIPCELLFDPAIVAQVLAGDFG